MKHEKTHPGSIGIPIGMTILILALTRGPLQSWLLLGVIMLWCLWSAAYCLLPRIQRSKRRKKRKRNRKIQFTEGPSIPEHQLQDIESPAAEAILLRHVNHRVSAYLQSAYPNATWEWEEKNPGLLALAGGTGRIRVSGVSDFSHADITLDTQANISCNMLKIIPLAIPNPSAEGSDSIPPTRQPIDPQVWYELQGRNTLESLVADLNSHGHSSLTLHEDGSACVVEGQGESVREHFPGFPEKVYWPRLAQVFESNGLAAEVTQSGIRLSW